MSYDGALGVLIFLFLPFLDGRDVIAALSYYWKFSVVDSELDAIVLIVMFARSSIVVALLRIEHQFHRTLE
jgi:hypothetical protein